MESIILKVAFSPPPSLFLNALSLINLPSFALNGFSESRGQNLQYSKFWHVGNNNNNYNNGDNNNNSNGYNSEKYSKKLGQRKVGSRRGMLICYTPAFLASAALFFIFPHENNLRLLLLNSALALHFFKRIFEVLYVHKYSGNMVLKTAIIISLSYLTSTTTMIYAQHLSQGLAEPQIDLKYIGLFMFLIGITGNFYHHYLLSQLRKKGDEKYEIPKWGLFGQVICPHYLFEIIEFVGFSFISQTLHSFSVALGTMFYLVGRSFATRQWYLSKFEDFPKNVKALIPYIF